MPNTLTLIQAYTVGAGGQASIDFTSIPSTYTDLVLKVSVRNSSTSDQVILKVNGSSSSLSSRLVYGAGSGTPASTTLTTGYAGTSVGTNQTASVFNNMEIYLPNYAGSANKSASIDSVMENNSTSSFAVLNAWLWSNTSAITSVSLSPDSGNFAQYSTAYLYGVKNA